MIFWMNYAYKCNGDKHVKYNFIHSIFLFKDSDVQHGHWCTVWPCHVAFRRRAPRCLANTWIIQRWAVLCSTYLSQCSQQVCHGKSTLKTHRAISRGINFNTAQISNLLATAVTSALRQEHTVPCLSDLSPASSKNSDGVGVCGMCVSAMPLISLLTAF